MRFRHIAIVSLMCVLVLLAACSGPGANQHPLALPGKATAPPKGLSGPALTAWYVLHTPRPSHDLSALATRLKHVAGPIASRATPLNEAVGAEDHFWIQPTRATYKSITAQLAYITPHVYDYVEDGTPVDMKALRAAADLFESTFYVGDRRYLGSEWEPGVDDDEHITILNAPDIMPDHAGYYSSVDEYPVAAAPNSNQREMIYVRIGGDTGLIPNTESYNDTLANEFAQMITEHLRPGDPKWLTAGLAVMGQHVNGLNTSNFDEDFLEATNTQLDAWSPGDGEVVDAHYGASYLFIDYFVEHYGGFPILRELLSDSAPAPLNFDDVLAAHGFTARFDDVFAQWVMTNALNDIILPDDQTYLYKTVAHLHAQLQHNVTTLPYSDHGTVQQYGTQYYDIQSPAGTDAPLTIAFAGQPTVPLISAPQPPSGTGFWWSNRGDNLDTALTRSFDLTHAQSSPITLDFSLWYDLEAGYDYGYAEVSTDGGKTWNPQPIQGASGDDNPHGANYGDGVTGGTTNGAWVPASIDLSAYSGKHIEVRFEAITDDMLNQQGMAIANIAMPALGYADTAQPGWDHQGWLYVAQNTLPQHYAVQVALLNNDGTLDHVATLPIDAVGQSKLTIDDFGTQINRAIVAVSALAPTTTIDANYTLNVGS